MIEKCCICGGAVHKVYSLPFEDIIGMEHDYTQHIGLCEKCGYLFTMNPFSEEQLENRYKNESKFEFDAGTYILKENTEYAVRSRRIRDYIYEHIGKIESVFEIGAASGYNLSLYSGAEKVLGCEPSALNCELAEKNYGIKMFNGSFREYMETNAGNKFQLIFLSMILEHIVNPYEFLSAIKSMNTGYMFIEVPVMEIKNIDEPFGMFCEEHVNLFTFEALNNMMSRLGYGLVDAKIEYGFDKGYPAGWPCIDSIWEKGRHPVRYRPAVPSEICFGEYVRKCEAELELIEKKIAVIPEDMPIAVWGTGHHVSMLLKNTSLGRKNIIRFYDSDSRKYKYQMHGKRILPFSIEDMEKCGIRGILIGTYIFQKEILHRLQSVSGDRYEIFTLYQGD